MEKMSRHRYPHSAGRLWAMALLALAYWGGLPALRAFVGRPVWVGSVGVFLGLFICSHPAANAIDLFFFRRYAWQELSAEWEGIGWLALNVLVMLLGWLVIALGAALLVAPAP